MGHIVCNGGRPPIASPSISMERADRPHLGLSDTGSQSHQMGTLTTPGPMGLGPVTCVPTGVGGADGPSVLRYRNFPVDRVPLDNCISLN